MKLFNIIKYQLYLLQLENYELGRYFVLLFKKGFWPKGDQRKELVWTLKARLLFILATLTHLGIFIFAVTLTVKGGLSVFSITYYVLSGILFYLYFLLYTVYIILLCPVDWLVKQIIITRARLRIKNKGSRITIIGIAGSYGKTTMKEVLKEVLGVRFQVLATPESVNTPVGIARWVLNKVDSSTEIIIVEMGEHYRGDVEEICGIAKPDIAVVTGINEAHLERMKTLQNITDTVFEVVSKSKAGALVTLNGDDKNVVGHYKEYVWPDHRVTMFGQNPKSEIRNPKFNTEKLCWEVEFEEVGKVDINLLGEYAIGDIDAAIKIAKSLGMSNEDIITSIKNIKPVEHRLQPIQSAGGVLVIDDAYNGNPAGVAEAIKVLSRFENRRKIYITPGLVETGRASKEIHLKIGQELSGVADVVILIKNSVTPFIEEGILSVPSRVQPREPSIRENTNQGIPRSGALSRNGKPEIIWFETAQEAHTSLPTILKPNDIILFQNDWGDQYI